MKYLLYIVFIETIVLGGLFFGGKSWINKSVESSIRTREKLFKNLEEELNGCFRDTFKAIEDELLSDFDYLRSLKDDEVRHFLRNSSLDYAYFKVNNKKEFIFPDLKKNHLSQKERELHQRINKILASIDFSLKKKNDIYLSENENVERNKLYKRYHFGWHAYEWGNQYQLLFLHKNSNGDIQGAEVNGVRVLSEIISIFPSDFSLSGPNKDIRLCLVDPKGDIFYQWGSLDDIDEKEPHLSHEFNTVLGKYKIELTIPKGQLSKEEQVYIKRFYLVFVIAFILLSVSLFLFFNKQRITIEEAKRRVSFVNHVSHEFRVPLTNIRLYSELLELDSPEGSEEKKSLKIILSEIHRLSRLVENVLSFSRFERKKVHLRKEPYLISELIDEVILTFQQDLDTKLFSFNFTNLGKEESIEVDRDAFHIILSNLISNSLKYCPVKSHIKVELNDASNGISFIYKDNGPGIPKEKEKDIFLPFFRLTNTINEGVSGTGIGLSIARSYARLHGGDLLLVSGSNGLCYRIEL